MKKDAHALPISKETKENIAKLFLSNSTLKEYEPRFAFRLYKDPELGDAIIVVASSSSGHTLNVMVYNDSYHYIIKNRDMTFCKSFDDWHWNTDVHDRRLFTILLDSILDEITDDLDDNEKEELFLSTLTILKAKGERKENEHADAGAGKAVSVEYTNECLLADIPKELMPIFLGLLSESYVSEADGNHTYRVAFSSKEFRKRTMRILGITERKYYGMIDELLEIKAIDHLYRSSKRNGMYRILVMPPEGMVETLSAINLARIAEEKRSKRDAKGKEDTHANCRNLVTGQFLSGAKRVKLSGNSAIKSFRSGGAGKTGRA